MFEEDDDDDEPEVKFGADMLRQKSAGVVVEEDVESYESIPTATEDKIFTESLHSSFGEVNMAVEFGDPINPIRVNKESIERQMPRLQRAKDI